MPPSLDLRSRLHRMGDCVVEAWRDCRYGQLRLVELNRPWLRTVPLCWRQTRRGWQLAGSVLPD